VDRQQLQELIDDGLSTREIGARVGLSPTTVRYWLRKHGLATSQTDRRQMASRARAIGVRRVRMLCRRHGFTMHRLRPDDSPACLRCRSESVARRRRRIKETLVDEAGGSCRLCGYSRSPAALVFHHVDRSLKSFGLAEGGRTRSLDRARKESEKCLLLCANCHAEVEAGTTVLSSPLAEAGPG
jgi:transposase